MLSIMKEAEGIMDLETKYTQKELVELAEEYNQIDSSVIKKNIIRCMDKSHYHRKGPKLAEDMGVDLQTVYLWRQPQKQTTIGFLSLVKLASLFGIPVRELIKPEEDNI